jgi:RNA polymerase sigma-70 factor (ECF subfamily)
MAIAFDTHLVQAAIGGSAPAVEALWRGSRRWVAAILVARMARRAELEDLLQEVAIGFVRGLRRLEAPEAFPAWLATIARNVALDSLRRQRRRAEPEPLDADGLVDPASTERPEQARAREALELIERLAPDYRDPLLLRCVRGLSQREIARILDLPETTIETRLARGRRLLREAFCTGAAGGARKALR